jgi:carbonic anhydrase
MPEHLIAGLRRFQRDVFPRYRDHYRRLVDEGQRPTTLFIGCADSRVVPDLLTDTLPGELFVLRNVGNLVPPFEPDAGYHGTSAGIEFAVLTLGVKDIVVCGHSDCGAIRALYRPPACPSAHIERWLDLARPARLGEAVAPAPVDAETLRRTEQRSIVVQVERLLAYPAVGERVARGELCLHGWYYQIADGLVQSLDVASGQFAPLVGARADW